MVRHAVQGNDEARMTNDETSEQHASLQFVSRHSSFGFRHSSFC
ncbi:hypothetical protein PLANPX_5747 [Lacipirellula parvula]|uniref:Uncharacterized protein n=1 Tax=Lacipirellula parvula TaxID=2650471 RepID=A0A5K7XIA9_9BACT|nr:hypothetical protein PLANPX_5747 [Lacipirellula parvula]